MRAPFFPWGRASLSILGLDCLPTGAPLRGHRSATGRRLGDGPAGRSLRTNAHEQALAPRCAVGQTAQHRFQIRVRLDVGPAAPLSECVHGLQSVEPRRTASRNPPCRWHGLRPTTRSFARQMGLYNLAGIVHHFRTVLEKSRAGSHPFDHGFFHA